MKFTGNPSRILKPVFNFQFKAIKAALPTNREAKFLNLRESSDNVFDGRRKDIHAADDKHVVDPPKDAANQLDPGSLAEIGLCVA